MAMHCSRTRAPTRTGRFRIRSGTGATTSQAAFCAVPSEHDTFGLKLSLARNEFTSSGQLPLDEVVAGRLDPFGSLDPTQGGKIGSGTLAGYWRREGEQGQVFKVDGFISRSLFDLFSNFTYYLNDPEQGDAIQQHDSRLIEGANAQYLRPHRLGGGHHALLTAGANYHDNQILVGLDSRLGRVPTGTVTRANARVTNGAGYVQESLSLFGDRLQLGGGLRFDTFRFDVQDRVTPDASGAQTAVRWQPKASAAWTPSSRVPVTLHANYGRGISTADARVIVQRPDSTRIANTDFYQFGLSSRIGRFSATADTFLIDRSSEQVYLADEGTYEFKGPSRAYGWESKLAYEFNRHLSLFGGVTKVGNAFFRASEDREYVTNAPHFVANAGITLSAWRRLERQFPYASDQPLPARRVRSVDTRRGSHGLGSGCRTPRCSWRRTKPYNR